MKKRILIPYATYGSGHKAIAKYIESYFSKQSNEYEILTVDLINYSKPIIGILSKKLSENLMIKMPWIWSILYSAFDMKISGKISSQLSMRMFKNKRLQQLITDFNPDLTISTHFYASSLIASYKRRKLINTKLITIVTDYKAHEFWLQSHKADDYLIVCSDEEKKQLAKRGIAKEKIKEYGIPIDPVLISTHDIEKSKKKHNLDNGNLSCLFFGGGGAKNRNSAMLPYIRKVIKMNLKINFLFVSGHDTKTKNKVSKWVKQYNATNIQVFGFVTNAPELYQIVDFVVTKPGGAQSTECLYFKKPVILLKGSGGQESANHRYFTKNGYGRRFKTVYSFVKFLSHIEDDESILNVMKERILKNKSEESMANLYKLAETLFLEK